MHRAFVCYWPYVLTILTFPVGEHLFLATEHGLQHRVLLRQHLQCGVKQGPSHVQPNILVPQTHRTSVTESIDLGTCQKRGWWVGASLGVKLLKAAVARHVPLKVNDHPADGGPDVPRRGDSYWGCRHNLLLVVQLIPAKLSMRVTSQSIHSLKTAGVIQLDSCHVLTS